MSEFGQIALAVLVGMFLALILAVAATLIWLGIAARRLVLQFQSTISSIQTEMQVTLKSHQDETREMISRINGDALIKSANAIVRASARIDRAALVIGELTLANEVKQDTGLKPDEYAEPEPGQPYITRTPTAQGDLDAARAESDDNSFQG